LFAGFFGFFSGAFIVLIPVVLALYYGLEDLNSIVGMEFAAVGL
jgi:hypothetical protein